MNKIVRYEIYKRENDKIVNLSVEELHSKLFENSSKELPVDLMIEDLHNNGYYVIPVKNIEVTEHGIKEIDSIQIALSNEVATNIIDINSEEIDGQLLTVIKFYGDDGKVIKRYYTGDGALYIKPDKNVEHIKETVNQEPEEGEVVEWCSICGEEVIIKGTKFVTQVCPSCGENIKACCLCEDCNYECIK